jgi:hypothetical protein
MDKRSIVDRIREVRHKKKEKKKTLSMAKCTSQRTTKRHYNAFFLSEWYIRNIRKVSDFFYNNI